MFSSQLYLIYLATIMIIVGIIKEFNLFSGVYLLLMEKIENKKTLVGLISAIGGVMPIPGRVVVSAGLLDTVAPDDKKKRKMLGMMDYISTHHYYLWSPLEKTIILPMAAFGLSYVTMLRYTAPLLLVYILFMVYFYKMVLNESDVDVHLAGDVEPKSVFHIIPLLSGIISLFLGVAPYTAFSIVSIYYICYFVKKTSFKNIIHLYKYLNFKLLVVLSIVLFASTWIKTYSEYFNSFLVSMSTDGIVSFVLISIAAFMFSFLMGSSSKFSGLVVLLVGLFGIQYLTFFLSLEFCAYLISPTHKCVPIANEYFGVEYSTFLNHLYPLLCLLMSMACFSIYF